MLQFTTRCIISTTLLLALAIASSPVNSARPEDVHCSLVAPDRQVGFQPYIVAVPGSGLNNASLMVSASGVEQLEAPLYLSADTGPTSHKHSHTMSLDPDERIYHHTFENFFSDASQIRGSIEITATISPTETVTTGAQTYERWPILREHSHQFTLADGSLEIVMDPATLAADLAYLLIINSYGLPAPLRPGYQQVSRSYAIQPSGAQASAERNYLLSFYYRDEALGNVNPADLAIFWYDAAEDAWRKLDSYVDADRREVTTATRRFGAFLLAGKPVSASELYLPLVLH